MYLNITYLMIKQSWWICFEWNSFSIIYHCFIELKVWTEGKSIQFLFFFNDIITYSIYLNIKSIIKSIPLIYLWWIEISESFQWKLMREFSLYFFISFLLFSFLKYTSSSLGKLKIQFSPSSPGKLIEISPPFSLRKLMKIASPSSRRKLMKKGLIDRFL